MERAEEDLEAALEAQRELEESFEEEVSLLAEELEGLVDGLTGHPRRTEAGASLPVLALPAGAHARRAVSAGGILVTPMARALHRSRVLGPGLIRLPRWRDVCFLAHLSPSPHT